MTFGFIKAARNVHAMCKQNLIMVQRIGGIRSFTEYNSEKELFLDTLPKVIDAIATSPQFTDISEFSNTIKQILEYNLSGGKYTRALSTILTYKYLEEPEKITEKSLELCRILGWCVEMFQAYWLMLDDIIDKSKTRRGRKCWYTLPDVGMRAVNDTSVMYGIMLKFLRTNFEHLPQYSKIMDQFNDALIHTAAGQQLDYKMTYQKEKDYMQFTGETYDVIVKYKTSYYTHVLPGYLGMILANTDHIDILKKAKEIGYKMGRLLQMQNDFVDTFSLKSVTDNLETTIENLDLSVLGTDIQEGKCSWLAVTALQNCNETQRNTFTKYYGSPDPRYVEEIRILYEQLRLPEIYKQEREMRYDEITHLAHDFSCIPRAPELFLGLFELFLGKK